MSLRTLRLVTPLFLVPMVSACSNQSSEGAKSPPAPRTPQAPGPSHLGAGGSLPADPELLQGLDTLPETVVTGLQRKVAYRLAEHLDRGRRTETSFERDGEGRVLSKSERITEEGTLLQESATRYAYGPDGGSMTSKSTEFDRDNDPQSWVETRETEYFPGTSMEKNEKVAWNGNPFSELACTLSDDALTVSCSHHFFRSGNIYSTSTTFADKSLARILKHETTSSHGFSLTENATYDSAGMQLSYTSTREEPDAESGTPSRQRRECSTSSRFVRHCLSTMEYPADQREAHDELELRTESFELMVRLKDGDRSEFLFRPLKTVTEYNRDAQTGKPCTRVWSYALTEGKFPKSFAAANVIEGKVTTTWSQTTSYDASNVNPVLTESRAENGEVYFRETLRYAD